MIMFSFIPILRFEARTITRSPDLARFSTLSSLEVPQLFCGIKVPSRFIALHSLHVQRNRFVCNECNVTSFRGIEVDSAPTQPKLVTKPMAAHFSRKETPSAIAKGEGRLVKHKVSELYRFLSSCPWCSRNRPECCSSSSSNCNRRRKEP